MQEAVEKQFQQQPEPVVAPDTPRPAHSGIYIICIMRNTVLGRLARVWRYYWSLLRLLLDRLLPPKRLSHAATKNLLLQSPSLGTP